MFDEDFTDFSSRDRMAKWDRRWAYLKFLPQVIVTPHSAFLTHVSEPLQPPASGGVPAAHCQAALKAHLQQLAAGNRRLLSCTLPTSINLPGGLPSVSTATYIAPLQEALSSIAETTVQNLKEAAAGGKLTNLVKPKT